MGADKQRCLYDCQIDSKRRLAFDSLASNIACDKVLGYLSTVEWSGYIDKVALTTTLEVPHHQRSFAKSSASMGRKVRVGHLMYAMQAVSVRLSAHKGFVSTENGQTFANPAAEKRRAMGKKETFTHVKVPIYFCASFMYPSCCVCLPLLRDERRLAFGKASARSRVVFYALGTIAI
eukprot:591713-Prorocentrum_minimum.AAC.2